MNNIINQQIKYKIEVQLSCSETWAGVGSCSCRGGCTTFCFFFSLRTTCLGMTSSKNEPPFHTVAETLRIWKARCNSYDRNIGTVSAVVATVKSPCRRIYIKGRF
ncbi:hypothetical protein Hanom_Chr10g00966461 [Helianthus anomalus]